MDRIFTIFGDIAHSKLGGADSLSDQLSCKFTVFLLSLVAIISTTKVFVDEPISCFCPIQFSGSQVDYAKKVCWVTNTHYVSMESLNLPEEHDPSKLFISYYQWIPLFLALQAVLFYLPRYIWKKMNQRSGMTVSHITDASIECQHKSDHESADKIMKYMIKYMSRFLMEFNRSYRTKRKILTHIRNKIQQASAFKNATAPFLTPSISLNKTTNLKSAPSYSLAATYSYNPSTKGETSNIYNSKIDYNGKSNMDNSNFKTNSRKLNNINPDNSIDTFSNVSSIIKSNATNTNNETNNNSNNSNGNTRGSVQERLIRFKNILQTIWSCGGGSGNYLTILYLLVKVLYLVNVLGQLFLMNSFLGSDYHLYGIDVIRRLINHQHWSTSYRFPRITICDFYIRVLANIHRHSVQCVLPMNLFYEIIFIFFWFWFVFVAMATIVSLIFWSTVCIYLPAQEKFIRHRLAAMDRVTKSHRVQIHSFVHDYLSRDGCFIIRMVAKNSSDLVASEFISGLWEHYLDKVVMLSPLGANKSRAKNNNDNVDDKDTEDGGYPNDFKEKGDFNSDDGFTKNATFKKEGGLMVGGVCSEYSSLPPPISHDSPRKKN